ncbi:MAG: GNAT family N-acetyltransferase [Armatimonadia bacterium]
MSDSPRAELRPAMPEQVALMARIIRKAFGPVAQQWGITREKLPNYASFETAAHLRKHMVERRITMFVLYEDDLPVGCGGCSPDQEVPAKGWLNRVAVPPANQGQGRGKLLVRLLEEELRRRGYTRVRLGCLPHLKGFYEALGYEVMGSWHIENWPADLLQMERDLVPTTEVQAVAETEEQEAVCSEEAPSDCCTK